MKNWGIALLGGALIILALIVLMIFNAFTEKTPKQIYCSCPVYVVTPSAIYHKP